MDVGDVLGGEMSYHAVRWLCICHDSSPPQNSHVYIIRLHVYCTNVVLTKLSK